MQQYQQKSPKIAALNKTDQQLTESQQKIALLENRVYTLQNTIDLQSRQIRRLESALQTLEYLVSRK